MERDTWRLWDPLELRGNLLGAALEMDLGFGFCFCFEFGFGSVRFVKPLGYLTILSA